MITDLERIKLLGELNHDENFDFRSWLKMQDTDKVDKIVHQLNQKYSAQIDCTTCANCCFVLKTLVTKKDIKKLALSLKIAENEFRKEYVETNREGDMMLKELPCSFLENKKCTVYPYRPHDCRSYPHLHKREFTHRLFGVIENYSVCPIVFNVYEELKVRLGFKRSIA